MIFSNLVDYSVIFAQICPKLPLYTKETKIKSTPETRTLQIPEMKICNWNQPFCNFTQNFLQFQNKQN